MQPTMHAHTMPCMHAVLTMQLPCKPHHASTDKDLAEKIKAEYGDHFPEELNGMAGLDGAQRGPPRAGRTVNVAVACMSRAGREPGYKKTNQDNCFAFEKFISEDESLFGAMDGHGPQGGWCAERRHVNECGACGVFCEGQGCLPWGRVFVII